jgi:hypothetical protein
MNTNFSVQQISDIAKKVHTYKKLFVTTNGQMFLNPIDAEEAVRTLNLIIEDANDHVGILEVTSDMLSLEKLRMFGKDPKLFGALFEKAKIPLAKNVERKQHTRLREEPTQDDKTVVNDVNSALGLGAPAPAQPVQKPQTPTK